MAGTALVYLVDRRDPAVVLFNLSDRVRVAMTVEAGGLSGVDTAADRPQLAAVTVAAAVLIGQRLHAALVAPVRDVRMAFPTGDIRVCRRRVLDVVVTLEAIEILGVYECANEKKSETENRFRARDPGRGHIYCPESLCEWC